MSPDPVTSPDDLVSIDEGITSRSSFLSPEHGTEEFSESNLSELFEQLQTAERVMDGVEDKLNSTMGQLDSLLEVLEKEKEQEQEKKREEDVSTDQKSRT